MTNLMPITVEHSDFIKSLALDNANREFFRTFSPVAMWPANAASFFPNGYIIRDLNTENNIGIISVNHIDPFNKQLEFGIVIGTNLCDNRQEFMVSALDMFIRFMFDYYQFNKLTCKLLGHRTKLMKVMYAHHFKKDGILRDNVFFEKKFHDEHVFSVISREYQ